jgi:hypothetical protein
MQAFPRSRYAIGVLLPLVLAAAAAGSPPPRAAEAPAAALDQSAFQNPPLAARPSALWAWLNGHVDHAQLTRELEEMKAKGMRGAIIWDVGAIADPEKSSRRAPRFSGRNRSPPSTT